MKRPVRPLYTILFLIVFSVAIITCRTSFLREFVSVQYDSTHELVVPKAPFFNATFIKFAEINVSNEKSKHDIEQLLEGNFNGHDQYRRFSAWRRFGTSNSTPSSSRITVVLRSPKIYRYWLEFRTALQNWSQKKKFHPEIMSEMIDLVKNPIDSYNNKTSGSKYSSCAVVGNSGILLKTEYGDLIDSHEFVIRLNNARVKKFEHNVGSKTSISFINSNILHLCARRPGCYCHPYGINVPMIMYICQPVHFLDYTLCNSWYKSPFLVTDPRFDLLCTRIVRYYSVKRFVEEMGKPIEEWGSAHDGSMFHYSSGFQAVMLALGICDKVSIFGFGKSIEAKHHYHTNQKAELHLHDYEAEYAFYHDLVERPQVIPFISNEFKIPPVLLHH